MQFIIIFCYFIFICVFFCLGWSSKNISEKNSSSKSIHVDSLSSIFDDESDDSEETDNFEESDDAEESEETESDDRKIKINSLSGSYPATQRIAEIHKTRKKLGATWLEIKKAESKLTDEDEPHHGKLSIESRQDEKNWFN